MEHKTVVIDVETTGLTYEIVPGKKPGTTRKRQFDYKTEYMRFPYIVSIAWKIDNTPTKHFIINQEGREIPKEASDIHGITTEIANKSPYLLDRVLDLFIGDLCDAEIVVGHNIYFDSSIIKANAKRSIELHHSNNGTYFHIEQALHKDKRIDTMRSAIKFFGKWPKLEELHNRLIGHDFPAHNAAEDVEATHRCYLKMIDMGLVPTFEGLQARAKK